MKGLGVAIIFLILSLLSVFFIDLGRIIHKQYDIPCFTNYNIFDPPTIDVSFWIMLLPTVLKGAAGPIMFLCIFEFLCSQTPFGMHGMLIGIFWFLRAICINIGRVIMLTFRYNDFTGPSVLRLSCTSWFTLFLGTIAIIGLVVYTITARWYVQRVRDDDLSLRATIEKKIERQIICEEFQSFSHDTDNDIVIIDIDDSIPIRNLN